MAEIEYDFSENDLEAFIIHHARNAPTVRRAIRRSCWILAAVFLAGAAVSVSVSTSQAIVYLTIGALIIALWPRWVRGRWRRATLKHYRSSKNLATFGRTQLKFEGESLTSASPFVTSTYKLQAVERIERSDSHAFIYVGPLTALVVPRHKVLTGNFDQFFEELERCESAAS